MLMVLRYGSAMLTVRRDLDTCVCVCVCVCVCLYIYAMGKCQTDCSQGPSCVCICGAINICYVLC